MKLKLRVVWDVERARPYGKPLVYALAVALADELELKFNRNFVVC